MSLLDRIRKIFSFKSKRGTIALCPVCYSPDLKPLTRLSGLLTPRVYICNKCGYKGPVYLEVDLEEYLKAKKVSS